MKEKNQTSNLAELAGSEYTSPEKLHELAKKGDNLVRIRVARNRKTLPDTLASLANDNDWTVVRSVAINPHTPSYILHNFALNKKFLEEVARNPSTPPDTLEYLTNLTPDQQPEKGLKKMFFTGLTQSEIDRIIEIVAGNPNYPTESVKKLIMDGKIDRNSTALSVSKERITVPLKVKDVLSFIPYVAQGEIRILPFSKRIEDGYNPQPLAYYDSNDIKRFEQSIETCKKEFAKNKNEYFRLSEENYTADMLLNANVIRIGAIPYNCYRLGGYADICITIEDIYWVRIKENYYM